ncbi:hypothetical protein C27AD_10476 [Salinisphaera hydrothermalis C27AD]
MARWTAEAGEAQSARAVYRDLEDHLTAAVFARLSYLPTDVFWLVLSRALDDMPTLFNQQPRLERITFWPRYSDGEDSYIEPDVLLEFDDFDVIVEAKRYDNTEPQTRQQVQAEIDSYRREHAKEKRVYCMLVSGNAEDDVYQVEGIAGLVQTTWLELRHAARYARHQASEPLDHKHWLRVLEDIEQALGLHGVQPPARIADIPAALITRISRLGSSEHLWGESN